MPGKRQNWFQHLGWNYSLRLNNYYCLQRNCTLTLICICISPLKPLLQPLLQTMLHLSWYFLVTKQFELHSDNVLGGPEFVQCNPATSDPGLWLGGRWREFLNLRPICVWDTLWKIISCKNVDWGRVELEINLLDVTRGLYEYVQVISGHYTTSLWFSLLEWNETYEFSSLCPVRFYFVTWLN